MPSDVISLEYDSVSEESLRAILSSCSGRVALSIKLPGLPSSSLGYIFFVETKDDLHTLTDIKNIVHFRSVSTGYLSRIICHSSGILYDSDVQSEFHRIRNEIGIN